MDLTEKNFDFLILGTGLTETALAALLSKDHSVLVLDRNSTYGSEFCTLSYLEAEAYFGSCMSCSCLVGLSSKFNIDLTPKLLLMESRLKDFFLYHKIEQLVNFTSIKASYIYRDKLQSIPRNEAQCIKSSVVPFLQKPYVARFFYNIRNLKKENFKNTMLEEFRHFGLNQSSIDFIGHAIALNLDDSYLQKEPSQTYSKIKDYIKSIISYDNTESPYIYPNYGLSDICQGFARKASVNGAIFMLGVDLNKIEVNKEESHCLITDANKQQHLIKARKIIADPSYFIDEEKVNIKTSVVRKEIIRCILICEKTEEKGSRNIIFLKSNLKRKNDVFCVILDSESMACPEGYEIVILSTVKETMYPETEIEGVIKKFRYVQKYISTRNIYYNKNENVIFTENVDESPLMDNIYEDIEKIIKKINE